MELDEIRPYVVHDLFEQFISRIDDNGDRCDIRGQTLPYGFLLECQSGFLPLGE